MSKNESNKRQDAPAEKDMVIKIGSIHLYFQNVYTLISLGNDLVTGAVYLVGSLANLLGWPAIIGNSLFVIGGLSLLMRPIIKIIHNIYIYSERRLEQDIEKSELDEELDEERPIDIKTTDDISQEDEHDEEI